MVKNIYLCSLEERVGKTLLSIGIMQHLKNKGYKVAYFKPIGIPKAAFSNKADIDVGFIQNTILEIDLPYDIVSPVAIPDSFYIDLIDANRKEEYLEKIKRAYDEIIKYVDYVVIEGAPSIKKYIRVGIDDVTIAKTLGIEELLFVNTDSSDRCIDNLFFTKNYFDFRGINIKGIIYNMIDHDYIARIEELEENNIKRYGIPLVGIVEKRFELYSPRVLEIQHAIGAELLNESAIAGLSNCVENYVIGAMNAQSALKYLRQVKNFAFITGGDRSDLILAALNQEVSTLILTGFIQPDTNVITAANKKEIPILLSPSDTYTTMRNIDRLKPGLQSDEIQLIAELVQKAFDWSVLE
ncbi:MAG: phosphotransacetylase family protein [Candidatus Lokiarchaeota archaeon]|nr:phosphotransacetylase family protein [Candidatus Lokiarchaeota archaeon]